MDQWQQKNIDELEDFIKILVSITSTNNLLDLKKLINAELKKRGE